MNMKIFLVIFLVLFSQLSFAENVTLPNTQIIKIKSKVNNIDYKIYISLPRNYETNTEKKYPIVYLLDRDYSFLIAHSIFQHFTERKRMEESILVGIGYEDSQEDSEAKLKNEQFPSYKKNRSRDYVPIKPNNVATDIYGFEYSAEMGGASKFRKFIKTELYDYLSQNFRINGKKTIAGHSYGGLFVVWSYLIDSKAFDNYIAISPSIWFNDNWVLSKVRPDRINKNAKLYISFGSEETERMKNGVIKLISKLQESGVNNENLKYELIANEDHSSIFPASLTHGFLLCNPDSK